MRNLFIPCFLLMAAMLTTLAADEVGELKPGRFVLITEGDGVRAPMIVNISQSETGALKVTLEDRPEISAEIKKSDNAYVFSLVIPVDRSKPPIGQDWPQRYYLTYAGAISEKSREALRGVRTEISTYSNQGSAPQATTAFFVLFSIDEAEKSKSANP